MVFRNYDPQKDKQSCMRIWHEVGWGEAEDNKPFEESVAHHRCRVAEINGDAECLVVNQMGDIDYLGERLPLVAVLGVTTSHVARQGGVAARLTAHSVAADVADGAAVAALAIFDQGYYNKLGFGNGTVEHIYRFDPQSLRVPRLTRPPVRLTLDDVERIHQARLLRTRGHGSLSIFNPGISRAEWREHNDAFGLGFENEQGELTHFFAMKGLGRENGPYSVRWTAWRTREQFLELMSMLRSLSDQIDVVRMSEPPDIQLQDLIEQPFRDQRRTEGGSNRVGISAIPYWQMRICDIDKCMAHTHLPWGVVRFNLVLSDPIERYLPEDAPWRGVGGEYVVTLGANSSVERGSDQTLATMRASVNAFTRLWLGVRPATGLSYTDDLDAPASLLRELDNLLRLPQPHIDWPI